jgi:hypothetical protein
MRAGIGLSAALCLAAIVGASAISAGASSGGHAQAAAAKRACDISGEQTELGASYVTSLKVRNTGCGKGKKVVKAFHECRKANGGRDGHCDHKVLGFKCHEGDREGVPDVQYNAKVRCKKGDKKVVHTYTQNV